MPELNKKQIKSKNRVSKYGEVFTNDREVNAMLDLVGQVIADITTTVLEPACGEGAFVVNVLQRKLKTISDTGVSGWALEYLVLQAVSSIYGVDIQKDNVIICQQRILDIVAQYMNDSWHASSQGFTKALNFIVSKNIICGNTLTASQPNGMPLKFSEWKFANDGTISRMQYTYQELLNGNGECTAKHRIIRYTWMKEQPDKNLTDLFLPHQEESLSIGTVPTY